MELETRKSVILQDERFSAGSENFIALRGYLYCFGFAVSVLP